MHGAGENKAPVSTSWFPGANGSLVDLSYGKGKIRITGFGRLYKGREVDWSFRPFQKFEDGAKDEPAAELLPEVASSRGSKEWLAPRPEFGTNLCAVNNLHTRIPFERGGKRVVLLRGATADIVSLRPGETFAISVGGCPIGWMFDPKRPDRLLVAHMGLKCLIDRPLVVTGQKSRVYSSVVDQMWKSMRLLPGEASRVQAGFAFPIHPLHNVHDWSYPTDGDENRRICEYLATTLGSNCIVDWGDKEKRRLGRIHLGNIIMYQYARLGIPTSNMHGAGAPDAVCKDGHPMWYVTRGPHGKDPRNLVLVTLYN